MIPQHERTARDLLQQGHATVGELLEVSLGEWPPKGLDINPAVTHAQTVEFRKFRARGAEPFKLWKIFKYAAEKASIAARASLVGPRTIRVNKFAAIRLPALLFQHDLASTMGHEVIHTLQGDHYYRTETTAGSPAYRFMDMLGRIEGEQKGNRARRAFHAVTGKLSGYPKLSYLNRGHETQAFLHESLARGYKKWGRMPGDLEELWAAMASLGLKPPEKIKAYLDARPAEAASHAFDARVRNVNGDNLIHVNASLSGEGRETFWRIVMPGIYADLIEMYGDRYGRNRLFSPKDPVAQKLLPLFFPDRRWAQPL